MNRFRANISYPLILVTVQLFLNCKEENVVEKIEKQLPQIVLERFSLTETQNGKKKWILYANTANVFDEIILVDTVRITFFDENEREFALITSRRGKLNTKNHNIVVRDSVILLTNDSTRLYTDSLFWLNDSQKVLTDSYVRIIKRDSTTIEGNGLKTTPDLKRIEIIGEIKGTSPIEFPKIK
uniref:LPS export ABC transporter periplasmic protein LptC n=1 Tax=candidate division WOR-3 bacterium TaxID=2052148 RepID=A0A7C4THV6_UNCW3